MSLQDRFEQAVADSKTLTSRPDNTTLLRLYALYKQATLGDSAGGRPSVIDFAGRAKWDAWHGVRGMSRESAQEQYTALVAELKAQ